MAIRKIKNKVQNSRAALQARYREVMELRADYLKALCRIKAETLALGVAQERAEAAEQKYEAGVKALNEERERLDGVFAARLQQARNEIAQLTGQVEFLQVRCRRLGVDNGVAEARAARYEDKARIERYWSLFACFALLAQTVYYEEWYVTVAEFVKGLL